MNTLKHIPCIFFVVSYFSIYATGQQQSSEKCASAIAAIRSIVNTVDGHIAERDCGECQGSPGKRGPKGFSGPVGPRGFKGDSGSCVCDLSAVEQIEKKLRRMNEEYCYAGVYSGYIPMSRIKASSIHYSCPFQYLRLLNPSGAWCAATNNGNQWLQVDLQEPTTVAGLLTQGRTNCCNQWVRSFKVSYGNSESSLAMYQENGATKIFTGNHDKTTIKENRFSQPITARYIRLHPVTWHEHLSMRIEILDC
ncbi:lactadherin-like [Styela clava]